MYNPPEDEDAHAQQETSHPTEYAYEHAQLPSSSVGFYNPWSYQGQPQAYETRQHPNPADMHPQSDPAPYPESSQRSTFSTESYAPAPMYMRGYREEVPSSQVSQPAHPFVWTDTNDRRAPEPTELLQPNIAGPSQTPYARLDPAEMMRSRMHQPPIPGQQLLPPPMSAVYYDPAQPVQGNPEASFSRRFSSPYLTSRQQDIHPGAAMNREVGDLHRKEIWWPETPTLTIDPYFGTTQIPPHALQSGPESGSYWPDSPASAPAWSGPRFSEGDVSPLDERRHTPYSDVAMDFGEGGWEEGADERQDTITALSAVSDFVTENKGNKGKGKGKEKRRVRERKHQCPSCNKTFDRPSSLAVHMNTHTGSKPFGCPVSGCTKRFAVQSNATRHLRSHGIELNNNTRDQGFAVSFNAPVVSHDVHSDVPQPSSYEWVRPHSSIADLEVGASAPPPERPEVPGGQAGDGAGRPRPPRRHTGDGPSEQGWREMHSGTSEHQQHGPQAGPSYSGQGTLGHSPWRWQDEGRGMSGGDDGDAYDQEESDERDGGERGPMGAG